MATDLRRAALSEEEKRKEVVGKKCRERKCEREKRNRQNENVEGKGGEKERNMRKTEKVREELNEQTY